MVNSHLLYRLSY